MTAGYSGTPLPRKLGVKEGTRLALLHAPDKFASSLGALPSRVAIRQRLGGEADVIVLFVTRFNRLKDDFAKAASMLPAGSGMLWIAWPKKAAKMDTDLDFDIVQKHGLASGLVDTKICAIDETWSGLRFSRRKRSS